jgi:N-acetylglucosamine-6-phosphate deacetylase
MLAIAGAHEPSLLRPFDLDDLTGVRLVTLAPELPGAIEVIARLRAAGVVVAAGHTEATDLSGVDGVTHVFNAMAPLHHRAPGPAGLALADDRLFVTLVADGEHVDPAVAVIVERAARERLVLVSDAVAGPTRRRDGGLAGGAVLLDGAVRNLAAWTGSPERAIRAATSAPARYARLPDRGQLRVGARADLVLLTPALEVVTTVVAGEIIWSRSSTEPGAAASGRLHDERPRPH